jgi:dihydrofolate reductase
MPKLLHVIVACAENRVIGRNGRLPWRIPEDLKFFHDETAGQICILGRVCYDTWPRVRKEGRQPIVLTSRPLAGARSYELAAQASHERPRSDTAPDADPIVAHSLDEALAFAESLPGEIYICGGQRIYEETLTLDRPTRLHLTLVHAEIAGDTFFPEWRHLPWRELSRRRSADANYRYTFFTLEK